MDNRFDLKGSTQNRRTLQERGDYYSSQRNQKVAMKDLDFRDHVGQVLLSNPKISHRPSLNRLNLQPARPLHTILASDAAFFALNNIIDYSLLLGVIQNTDEVLKELESGERPSNGNLYFSPQGVDPKQGYIIGVIDIFTEYNSKKKGEYYFKRVKYRGNVMSCVPPEMYAERFLKFMKKSLVV